MCGIWASLGLTVDDSVIASVAHRGPDGSGLERFATPAGQLVLGHNRLAILDTSSAGLQPMRRGNAVIVLNGQIYNYLELREELEALGERFTSATDTEVLLAAYKCWGTSCLSRFRGMFAFAIYDGASQRLFLARDRFGIKPLYYYETSRGFAFASEIKQFRGVADFLARMNAQRAYDFVASGLLDHDEETLFAGVRQFTGGTTLEIDLCRSRVETLPQPRRWYKLPEPNTVTMDLPEAAERYRALLDDAVRLHLRADVPVGSCLSGGLDSSSIVALASRRIGDLRVQGRFSTVTAAYDAPEVDERGYAAAMSASAGITNHLVFPRADGLRETLDKLVWHQDEPFGSSSIFAQWCVFERARQLGIKVMLDGQGADEHLGGYHYYFAVVYRQLAQDRRFCQILRLYQARLADHLVAPIEELKRIVAGILPWQAGAAVHRWLNGDADRCFRRAFLATIDTSLTPAERAARRIGPPPRRLGAMLSAQTRVTNLPMLLHFEDRSSMAHGIEARVPFLDHPLVEFAISLGDAHKIEGVETKVLLRRAMQSELPSSIYARKDKIGFATPEGRWFTGNMREVLKSEISSLPRRLPGIFSDAALENLAAEVGVGKRPLQGLGWRLACLSSWSRVHGVTA